MGVVVARYFAAGRALDQLPRRRRPRDGEASDVSGLAVFVSFALLRFQDFCPVLTRLLLVRK